MTLQGIQFFRRLQAVYCAELIEKIQSIQKRMTLVRGRLHVAHIRYIEYEQVLRMYCCDKKKNKLAA